MEEMDFSPGAQEELRDVTDLYLYNNSVLLLILAAQMQAFENPGASTRPATTPAEHPSAPGVAYPGKGAKRSAGNAQDL